MCEHSGMDHFGKGIWVNNSKYVTYVRPLFCFKRRQQIHFLWGVLLWMDDSDMMKSRRGKKARRLPAAVSSLPSFVEILFLHIIGAIEDVMDRYNLLAVNWMQSESEKIWIVCSDSPEISDLIFTKYLRAESSSYPADLGETP